MNSDPRAKGTSTAYVGRRDDPADRAGAPRGTRRADSGGRREALLQSGARALIAAEDGPLAEDSGPSAANGFRSRTTPSTPSNLRRCAQALERLIASERVDIVHAQSIGGAWARPYGRHADRGMAGHNAARRAGGVRGLRAYWAGALARGDRVITPSNYAAAPMMKRFNLPRERLTIIPRSIDTEASTRGSDRRSQDALRAGWRVSRMTARSGARTSGPMERSDHSTGGRAHAHRSGVRDLAHCDGGRAQSFGNMLASSRNRRKAEKLGDYCGSADIATTCRQRTPRPTSSRCPRSSRPCSVASSPRRKLWAGRSSPQYRGIAGARRDPAGNAGRHPHWLAGRARRCGRFCPCPKHGILARSTGLPRHGARAPPIRGVHVFPPQHRNRHPGRLYLAAGARYLAVPIEPFRRFRQLLQPR